MMLGWGGEHHTGRMNHKGKGPVGYPAKSLARGYPNPSGFALEDFCQRVGTNGSISMAMQHHNIAFCLHPTLERKLQLEKTNRSISVKEGEEVTLPCLLQGTHLPTTHLSATWFRGKKNGRISTLLTLHHDGTIKYPWESLAGRLHLRRPGAGDFSLTLHSVEKDDAGVYHCQVQEWQQQSEGKDWTLQALAYSGYTQLTTVPLGNAAGCKGLLMLHWFPFNCAGVCVWDNGSSLLAILTAMARMQWGQDLPRDCRGDQCWGDCQSCIGTQEREGSPFEGHVLLPDGGGNEIPVPLICRG